MKQSRAAPNPTRTSQVPAAPIPEVYVLWHPNCALGQDLAERIMTWLRPGNGLGPEVFYRSLPAPGASAGELPLPLRQQSGSGKGGNRQLIVALIDENMVSDFAWRHWLDTLATNATTQNRVIWPVALDATAYNMPARIKELNYFRPTGLPVPTYSDERKARLEVVIRSLLKQLTEAMCRVILPKPDGSTGDGPGSFDPLSKVSVFISHAKVDGTTPARRVRDYIYSQTQLAAFYDENDISYGAGFANTIEQRLKSSDTAALIAVRSTRYASRPWCRRELSLFRRPQQEGAGSIYWRLHPSLVVEAMEGNELSAGIPELGNSSCIRWNDNERELEELIVTTVIRDAMLASFHSALGKRIKTKDKPARGKRIKTKQIVINWLPDPMTLLHIPEARSYAYCNVFYPGRGLSGLELKTFRDLFPQLTFWSFEEALS